MLGPPLAALLAVLAHELRVEQLAEAVDHHLLDGAFEPLALFGAVVDEADAHARLVVLGDAGRRRLALALDPFDLAADLDGLVHLGDAELEQKDGADVERLLGADEGAALADVLGVVRKEGVELLVLDLELDGDAWLSTPVVVGHWIA